MKIIQKYTAVKYKVKLTREELEALIVKAQAGCLESRNIELECNCGLIGKSAASAGYHAPWSADFDDCFQQGVLGIMRAVETFDVSKGFAFSTYAMFWVNQSIRRYVDDNIHAVRTPVYLKDLQRRYHQIQIEHGSKDEEFWLQMIASERGSSSEGLKMSLRSAVKMSSLNVENDEGATAIGEIPYIVEEMGDPLLEEGVIRKLVLTLPARERSIIELRMEGETLASIGQMYKLSKESIRLIQEHALIKLKVLMNQIREEGK